MSRRKTAASPLELWRVSLDTAQMIAEAQMVMAYRMLGLWGLWAVTPSERDRMVDEKLPVFADAAMAAGRVAAGGGRPDQIWAAALGPIGRRTRSNARRLSRRGPKTRW